MATRFSTNERTGDAMIKLPSKGTDVAVVNGTEIKHHLDAVHKGDASFDYVVLSYDGTSTTNIVELGSGVGGVSEVQKLLKDDIIAYGLVRVVDTVDQNVKTNRFALIVFNGDKVPGARKGRISTNKEAVLAFIGAYNVELNISDITDANETLVMNKIQDASGSRIHEKQLSEEQKKAAITDSPKPAAPKTKAEPVRDLQGKVNTKSEAGMVFEQECQDAIKKVRDNKDPTQWMLMGYKGQKNIVLQATGNGDIEELKTNLKPEEAQYGYIRLDDEVDGNKVDKFVVLLYQGPNIKPMMRGLLATHRGAVIDYVSKFTYHTDIQFNDAADISTEIMMAKLKNKAK